jgi:cell division protein FtsW
MKSAAITSRSTWKRFKGVLPFDSRGNSDKLLLFVAISLAAFGLVMVYSASYIFAQEKYGDGLYYFNHHLVFLALGFGAMVFCRFFDLRLIHQLAWFIFVASLGLMALTQVPGLSHRAGGAARWISIGGFTIQPVEFAKIAFVIVMARLLAAENRDWSRWTTGFLNFLPIPALTIAFCMVQKDFGSSALVIAVSGVMLYLAGVRFRFLAASVAAVVPFVAGAILLFPYRRARMMTFLDPWADPQGAGFQVVQSFIAFYRGGLFGAGLGASRAKVFYLPEAHNDFILSVVGEELGFLGIGVLSFVFLVLIFRGIRASAKTGDRFHALLAAGLTILLGLEVFWNASVVLGLFPNKGMNLPFISSGGSSIICALSIVGILLNVSAQQGRGYDG